MRLASLVAVGFLLALPGCAVYPAEFGGPAYAVPGPVVVGPGYGYAPPPPVVVVPRHGYRHGYDRFHDRRDWRGRHDRHERHDRFRGDHGRWR